MTCRFRILALDVDGTLLNSQGVLSPRTATAVQRAGKAGIRPVLCTGRRFRRARPIADQLGLVTPIVCNSGAIVKDPRAQSTLWRADFAPETTNRLLQLFKIHEQDLVSFTDRGHHERDFIIARFPTGRRGFDDYVGQNREHAEIDPDWTRRRRQDAAHAVADPCFHICAIGTRNEMLDFQQRIQSQLDGHVQTFVQRSPRYMGTMCEVLRGDASKWTAVLHLASHWGVDPEEICAVGDDVNDIPMIRHAGLGVAMGHASAAVQAEADLVTGDQDQDGVAMLIEGVLLAG